MNAVTEMPFLAHELIAGLLRTKDTDWTNNKDIADTLQKATKFHLGDLPGVTDMYEISKGEFFELPAPVCLFQVDQPAKNIEPSKLREGGFPYTVILLACEVNQVKETTAVRGALWKLFLKIQGRWGHAPHVFFIDESGSVDIVWEASAKIEEKDSRCRTLVEVVARAIEVFSCSNVFTVEHAPHKFINAKRIAKGKMPLFAYRTLHIRDDEDRRIDRWNKTSHESPRLHLRRGHIRKLQSGERIWVRAHLVGDKSKGFTHNDYIVEPRTH